MAEVAHTRPSDWQQREQAVDISLSCIVQAPAGSGKTELLVQRILALLAVAQAPEEILSITFTRKAASEMRLRLLQALDRAAIDQPPVDEHARATWQRARSVLARDRVKKWGLLQNPARLQLMTIDSLCAYLTRRMPWIARFGEQPVVTDDPGDLYLQAAESLLSRLEDGGAGQENIEILLVHLDNRLTLLRDLLVAMLARRDQWLRHLLPRRNLQPRKVLEDGLTLYVNSFLYFAYETLGPETYSEILELGSYAAACLEHEPDDNLFVELMGTNDMPGTLHRWLAIAHLVLTSAGTVRKSVNKKIGFPSDKTPLAQEMKSRAQTLLDGIRDNRKITDVLQGLRKLPATRYEPVQWEVLQSLIDLLPLAVVELQNVFRIKGVVDFIEIAGAAQAALGSVASPEDLLLQLDSRLQHILVDEFQDTSYAQYDLLRCLTAGWTPGDGRTLFVVGDPMQSIYRFREAEVGLYLRVCQRGLDSLPIERIVLNTNFRSSSAIVEWTNATFQWLFPEQEDELRGAVRFSFATAYDLQTTGSYVSFHGFEGRQDQREAQEVLRLIQQARRDDPQGTVAVLVRSRAHLTEIVAVLKEAGLRYQAQDIDPLIDRPVVQDIVSLARALHRPADRVSWLALLRAPWCGMSLEDLVCLCSRDARSTIWYLLNKDEQQEEMFDYISEDGRQRLARIMPVLEQAMSNRGRVSLRRLVESAWLALNGPACVDEMGLQDAVQTFALLDSVDRNKGLDDLESQLSKLFAGPDPQAGPESVQLMTIHKAKGLEFDTVILPGLGRGVRGQERSLLRWLEHPDYDLLLAPIPPLLLDQQEPIYSFIGHILQEKDNLETVRLLYVAATRAKSRLHLLGHVNRSRSAEIEPYAGSLLSVLWLTCDAQFKENLVPASADGPGEMRPLTLKRLPLDWQTPPMPAKLPVSHVAVRRASKTDHYDDQVAQSLWAEEGRLVGVLVHEWLEKIAVEGTDAWPVPEIMARQENFKARLILLGIPLTRVEACTGQVLKCLVNSVTGTRGRWVLAQHQESACELALNGLIDGQLARATIDRTFIDNDGVRWVIDYKTSSPVQGDKPDSFMAREADRYHEQLHIYSSLMKQLEGQNEVRAALYFPAFDGWFEL